LKANSFCPTNSFFKFPEDLERIFQPFQQATAPGLLNTKGTGLGLSLTRQLVELLRFGVRSGHGMKEKH
jgi:K+-sensing histidine kinase KdpD